MRLMFAYPEKLDYRIGFYIEDFLRNCFSISFQRFFPLKKTIFRERRRKNAVKLYKQIVDKFYVKNIRWKYFSNQISNCDNLNSLVKSSQNQLIILILSSAQRFALRNFV